MEIDQNILEKYQYKLLSVIMNDNTIIRPGRLTVLVGPNNAGKSRALKDIASLTTLQNPFPSIVVSAVEVNYPSTLADLQKTYSVERHQDQNGNWMYRGLSTELTQEKLLGGPAWPTYDEQQFANRNNNFKPYFTERFGSAMVAFLTTEARLQLVRQGGSASDYRQVSSLLQVLYNSGSLAACEISTLVKQAFGQEIALDFTVPQQLQLRVGDDFSRMPPDPRDARLLMQECDRMDDQGDGIRSFVGISVALLILKRSLFLIDEPEAFLHPPQAYRMGAFIADQANRSRQIIIATHSADVLRGILSRTQDVDILRIDRVANKNTFCHLDTARLKEIINDPLLTSARVLDGLFYSAAVVVEADSDARFYHAASGRQTPDLDLHFVNADNKQTVPRIVRLYRDMGVRSAGIVDFDVLNDRTELEKSFRMLEIIDSDIATLLEAQRRIGQAAKELPAKDRLDSVRAKLDEILEGIEQITTRSFTSIEDEQRSNDSLLRQLESRFRELADMSKAWKVLKQLGRAGLPADTSAAFDHIWDKCAEHGFFINPTGELESMLADYGIQPTTDKKGWITQALQVVSSLEPNDRKYPWAFLSAVHKYLQPSTEIEIAMLDEVPNKGVNQEYE